MKRDITAYEVQVIILRGCVCGSNDGEKAWRRDGEVAR